MADARGNTLVLGQARPSHRMPSVARLVMWGPGHEHPGGLWDTVISLGELWNSPDLSSRLEQVKTGLVTDGRLLFIEPTVTADAGQGPPHDITAELWAADLSVIDNRRFTVRTGRHSTAFVRGIARHRRHH